MMMIMTMTTMRLKVILTMTLMMTMLELTRREERRPGSESYGEEKRFEQSWKRKKD